MIMVVGDLWYRNLKKKFFSTELEIIRSDFIAVLEIGKNREEEVTQFCLY